MSLRDDVIAGLAAIDNANAKTPLALNSEDTCVVHVPIPPAVAELTDNRLLVQVQVSRTGRFFGLRSPLAQVRATPTTPFYKELLQRAYYPDPISGLGVALSIEDDVVVASYHWILDHISADDFAALFGNFTTGIFDLLGAIAAMARKEPGIEPVHPKAS